MRPKKNDRKTSLWAAILVATTVLFLNACGQETAQDVAGNPLSVERNDVISPTKEVLVFPLGATLDSLPINEKDLFGHFYNRRAHFYKVKEPNANIFGAIADDLTLYFIDSTLARVKYGLHDNIANRLINALGNFKITPLNDTTYQMIQRDSVVTRRNGWIRLNPALTHYELRWKRQEYSIVLKVQNSHQENGAIEYIEEIDLYKEALKSVEHSLGMSPE